MNAFFITNKIFSELIVELKNHSFNSEKQIDSFLQQRTKHYNAKLAFPPIVANNSGVIHPEPRNRKLQKGFLIVDFGVRFNNICSDCTRTFYLGKPSLENVRLYELVLLAQETSLKYAQPGIKAADVDLIARTILSDYPMNFCHALGHGVGRRIHQHPRIFPNSVEKLKKGQLITIEPGLYFKNKGLRIEDTVVVGNIPKILTRTSKKLLTF